MRQAKEAPFKGHFALIAVGSNQNSIWGTPFDTVIQAVRELSAQFGATADTSLFYATPAFPAGSGPDFVNAAVRIETSLDADAVLATLHAVEAKAGRLRETRWGQRTLDLDLIGLGDVVAPDAAGFCAWRDLGLADQQSQAPQHLILPHPRLQDRAFVLVPLADVAPDWVHPVSGDTVTQMLAALPDADRDAVRVLE